MLFMVEVQNLKQKPILPIFYKTLSRILPSG